MLVPSTYFGVILLGSVIRDIFNSVKRTLIRSEEFIWKWAFIRSFTVPRSGSVTRHQYGISAVISQTSFLGETSGGIGSKCQQFSKVIHKLDCFQIRSLDCYFFTRVFLAYLFSFHKQKIKNSPTMPINNARSL